MLSFGAVIHTQFTQLLFESVSPLVLVYSPSVTTVAPWPPLIPCTASNPQAHLDGTSSSQWRGIDFTLWDGCFCYSLTTIFHCCLFTAQLWDSASLSDCVLLEADWGVLVQWGRVIPDVPLSSHVPLGGALWQGVGAIGTSWVVVQQMAVWTVEGIRKPAVSLLFSHLYQGNRWLLGREGASHLLGNSRMFVVF